MDDLARKQVPRTDRSRAVAPVVDKFRQIANAVLVIEVLDGGHAFEVDGHGNDRKALCAETRLKPIEARHLLAAWVAPSGPEIEQNDDVSGDEGDHDFAIRIETPRRSSP